MPVHLVLLREVVRFLWSEDLHECLEIDVIMIQTVFAQNRVEFVRGEVYLVLVEEPLELLQGQRVVVRDVVEDLKQEDAGDKIRGK